MPSSLTIGFVIDTSLDSNDGVQQYVKTVGAWLSNQGHEVHYLTSAANIESWAGGKVHSLSKTINVRFNGNRLTMPLLSKKRDIKKVLTNTHFDVLHVQVPYSPLLAERVISYANADTAIIGTFHILPVGVFQFAGSKILSAAYWRSRRRFDAMIAVSPAAKLFADKAFNFRCVLVPNAVDTKQFTSNITDAKKSLPKIVFLGRLVERKGALQLLRAYERLLISKPNTRLVIAGDGPARPKLESFVKSHKLSEKVSMLGFIDEAEKAPLLASADIACFPAMYGESFGIVLVEAMAAGSRVVLGGDNPGYRSVLGQQTELLIDPKNIGQFTSRLDLLLSDQDLIARLHKWQNEHVKQYDIDVVGRQILDIYNVAIAKRTKK